VDRVNSLLVKVVCKEGLPFRLVESKSFKAFVGELDPRYAVPTRKELSTHLLSETYDATKALIKADIAVAKAVALTTDMWTSSANQSYMGVTAHWLTDEFKSQNKCLAVRPAPGSHTAEFIAAEFASVLQEWALNDRAVHVVTDNGANVKKAIAQLPNATWRACFAHTLQLCVCGGLQSKDVSDLPKLLAKARSIVGHFRRRPLATSQLERAQQQLSVPKHKLLQDCATRWNSQVTNLY
jgi:zinc finger BED domain-containing protein 1 (E3 SUMO-protein ligase ZBED1)